MSIFNDELMSHPKRNQNKKDENETNKKIEEWSTNFRFYD